MFARSARYSLKNNRHPPPEYDKFFEFTQQNGCLIDEYDKVHRDFEPFYQIAEYHPNFFLDMLDKAMKTADDSALCLTPFTIKNHNASRGPHYTPFGDDWQHIMDKTRRLRVCTEKVGPRLQNCNPDPNNAEHAVYLEEEIKANYKYKYLLDLDGNSFSGRYFGLLRSGSLVFKSSTFSEFFDDWLIPYVHFTPVLPYLSDLEKNIEWAIENHEEARQIQANGLEYAKRVLTDNQYPGLLATLRTAAHPHKVVVNVEEVVNVGEVVSTSKEEHNLSVSSALQGKAKEARTARGCVEMRHPTADWDEVRRRMNCGEAWAEFVSESESESGGASVSDLNCTKWGKNKKTQQGCERKTRTAASYLKSREARDWESREGGDWDGESSVCFGGYGMGETAAEMTDRDPQFTHLARYHARHLS
ncbi:hypothetical protein DFH08DRAFT_802355 [Mycena albidolilacea]|uniref:Glycosyl transferase CAP10 domain-containing protein n=1 Tax=Mycena albidolilacea TaxID=1033008 RepID=A0AAD7EZM3_9AGAR|nr:hypothetical protein DFH08DRAFT_802355 [Mycena albidolilacea]